MRHPSFNYGAELMKGGSSRREDLPEAPEFPCHVKAAIKNMQEAMQKVPSIRRNEPFYFSDLHVKPR